MASLEIDISASDRSLLDGSERGPSQDGGSAPNFRPADEEYSSAGAVQEWPAFADEGAAPERSTNGEQVPPMQEWPDPPRGRARPQTWFGGRASVEDFSGGEGAAPRPTLPRSLTLPRIRGAGARGTLLLRRGADNARGTLRGYIGKKRHRDTYKGMDIDYNGLVNASAIDMFNNPINGDTSPADSEDTHRSRRPSKLLTKLPASVKQLSPEEEEDAMTIAYVAKQLRSNFLFLSFDDEELSRFASQFEVCEYPEGGVIIEEGNVKDGEKMYFYVLIEGECNIVKDGKLLPGKYGTLGPGASFGEKSVLFDSRERGATIIASKASKKSGKIVLYRLDGAILKGEMDEDEIAQLQQRMRDVIKVFDVLSGIDVKIKKKGTIIRPYKPSKIFLTFQWTGTILQYVWKETVVLMVTTAILGMLIEKFSLGGIGYGWDTEYEPNSLLHHLDLIAGWWTMLQPLTTFVATFFLAEAFKFWSRFYWSTRGMQGRFNDLSLIIASTADRGEDGEITPQAKKALDDIARMMRLLHQLYWSAVVKRFNVLQSPEGLSYLRSFSLITDEEFDSLRKVAANKLGGHHAAMTWLTTRIFLAREKGEIKNDHAAMQMMLDKLTNLRMLMARLPDMYDGRMPLAYLHFVYLLVNTLTFLSPIALFPTIYYWAIPAVGVLSVFYNGIFTLSLMFLDPVDNDDMHSSGILGESAGFDVGVLIRESNAGSIRFAGCALALPKNFVEK